jgi:hypothetical protein
VQASLKVALVRAHGVVVEAVEREARHAGARRDPAVWTEHEAAAHVLVEPARRGVRDEVAPVHEAVRLVHVAVEVVGE